VRRLVQPALCRLRTECVPVHLPSQQFQLVAQRCSARHRVLSWHSTECVSSAEPRLSTEALKPVRRLCSPATLCEFRSECWPQWFPSLAVPLVA
jgi:hypothetical protein